MISSHGSDNSRMIPVIVGSMRPLRYSRTGPYRCCCEPRLIRNGNKNVGVRKSRIKKNIPTQSCRSEINLRRVSLSNDNIRVGIMKRLHVLDPKKAKKNVRPLFKGGSAGANH